MDSTVATFIKMTQKSKEKKTNGDISRMHITKHGLKQVLYDITIL